MEKMTIFFKADNAILTDYLRYLFPVDTEDGICMVKSVSDFGKLLISHMRESERPPRKPEGENVLELGIPLCDTTQHLVNKFLYFSDGDMKRLNAGLAAVFDIDLKAFYLKAEGLGYSKKDIIEAFIISRGLAACDPYDALHKRIYRAEQAKMKAVSRKLVRKVYYMFESLDLDELNTKHV